MDAHSRIRMTERRAAEETGEFERPLMKRYALCAKSADRRANSFAPNVISNGYTRIRMLVCSGDRNTREFDCSDYQID